MQHRPYSIQGKYSLPRQNIFPKMLQEPEGSSQRTTTFTLPEPDQYIPDLPTFSYILIIPPYQRQFFQMAS